MTVTYKNQKFSLASFLSRTFIDCGLHHIFVGLVQGVQGTILHCLSHVFTTFFQKKKKTNKQTNKNLFRILIMVRNWWIFYLCFCDQRRRESSWGLFSWEIFYSVYLPYVGL